ANAASPGPQLADEPPDATPATADPAPRSTKRGPPGAPEHVSDCLRSKLRHTEVSLETSLAHGPIGTSPERLRPKSCALPIVRPNPTIVPGVPAGGATVLTCDG